MHAEQVFEKHCVQKEKMLVMSDFYLFGGLSAIFIKFETVVCQIFQLGRL